MKAHLLALTTALSLVAFVPAYAEDLTGVDPACIMKNADGTDMVDKTKCPDGKMPGAASNTTEQPAVKSPAEQPATTPPATTTAEQPAASDTTATATAAPVEIIVPADQLNAAKLMTASDYIGKRVYDRTGADIGEVNDLILSEDSRIAATILGVGGFLGMGEKNVAVSVKSIEMVKDGESTKLVVDATKEQLDKAPSYDVRARRYAS